MKGNNAEFHYIVIMLLALLNESAKTRNQFPKLTIYGPKRNDDGYEVWLGVTGNSDEDIQGSGLTLHTAFVKCLAKANPDLLHKLQQLHQGK
jgi:hypothetical protein